jgi:AAA+ superfamily predicted ATPase
MISSVLLRVLEYYQGIMILTTNRITSLDVAVQSRIHLAIKYSDLLPKQKAKIFKGFLDNLGDGKIGDRQKIDFYIEVNSEETELNGRQIRNVISSAQALANNAGTKLKLDHIKKVMMLTKEFNK